ncbi:MAG: hypothetical protein P1V51_11605 [Deltaproteobacteria bacterium]|nr:hypothetical protein [Deltaproteobacteria bacterium]
MRKEKRRTPGEVVLFLGLLLALPGAARAQNQPPLLTLTDALGNQLLDGDQRTASEGDTLTLQIASVDPEGATVNITVGVFDAAGNLTGYGSYAPATGEWSWVLGQGTCSPVLQYTIVVQACDDQNACTGLSLGLTVRPVAIVPSTPQQVAPPDGAIVTTVAPTLTVNQGVSPGSSPEYEFELYYYLNPGPAPASAPDQSSGRIAAGAGGQTSWVTAGIPENTLVYWRVRMHDLICGEDRASPWSGYWSFFVNGVCDAPLAPLLVTPAEGAVLDTPTPTLVANNTTDPNGGATDLYFEVATDDTFALVSATSPALPQSAGTTTSWIVDPPLEWGRSYAARAYANLTGPICGGQSAFSNIIHFQIRPPEPPTEVVLLDLAADCDEHVYRGTPDHLDVSLSQTETGHPIIIELELRTHPTGLLLGQTSVTQLDAGTFTRVPIDPAWLRENGLHRVRVRARDGDATSDWSSCTFWLDALSSLPGPPTVRSPTLDEVFPATTTDVTIELTDPVDEDSVVPGNSLELAVCHRVDHDGLVPPAQVCSLDPTEWPLRLPLQAGPTTTVTVSSLTGGAPLQPWDLVSVGFAAIDERGGVSPVASAVFLIEADPACERLGCAAGEFCDSSSGCLDCADCQPGDLCDHALICPEVATPPPDDVHSDCGDPGTECGAFPGCGCSAGGPSPGAAGLLLALLALAYRGRGGSKRARSSRQP